MNSTPFIFLMTMTQYMYSHGCHCLHVLLYGESSLTGTFPYMRVERMESGLTSSKIKIILKKKCHLKKCVGNASQ